MVVEHAADCIVGEDVEKMNTMISYESKSSLQYRWQKELGNIVKAITDQILGDD